MKLASLILSIVVLILSSMPCSDMRAISLKFKQQVIADGNNKDETNHSDTCTPFCHCACCASFAVNHTIPVLEITPTTEKILYSEFYFTRLISIAIPVWQPPQIS